MPDEITKAKTEISQSAGEAVLTIATAAREAAHVIACAASEALKVKTAEDKSDHDTITKIVGSVENIDKKFTEKFAEIRTDIKEIKDGTAARIDALEKEKNNVKSSYIVLFKEGVDKSIENIEADIVQIKLKNSNQKVTMGIGIAILTALVSLMVYHIVK